MLHLLRGCLAAALPGDCLRLGRDLSKVLFLTRHCRKLLPSTRDLTNYMYSIRVGAYDSVTKQIHLRLIFSLRASEKYVTSWSLWVLKG